MLSLDGWNAVKVVNEEQRTVRVKPSDRGVMFGTEIGGNELYTGSDYLPFVAIKSGRSRDRGFIDEDRLRCKARERTSLAHSGRSYRANRIASPA